MLVHYSRVTEEFTLFCFKLPAAFRKQQSSAVRSITVESETSLSGSVETSGWRVETCPSWRLDSTTAGKYDWIYWRITETTAAFMETLSPTRTVEMRDYKVIKTQTITIRIQNPRTQTLYRVELNLSDKLFGSEPIFSVIECFASNYW